MSVLSVILHFIHIKFYKQFRNLSVHITFIHIKFYKQLCTVTFVSNLSRLLLFIMFNKVIRADDPRILNPTFSFNIPWGNDDENVIESDDDDILMCTIPWGEKRY